MEGLELDTGAGFDDIMGGDVTPYDDTTGPAFTESFAGPTDVTSAGETLDAGLSGAPTGGDDGTTIFNDQRADFTQDLAGGNADPGAAGGDATANGDDASAAGNTPSALATVGAAATLGSLAQAGAAGASAATRTSAKQLGVNLFPGGARPDGRKPRLASFLSGASSRSNMILLGGAALLGFALLAKHRA